MSEELAEEIVTSFMNATNNASYAIASGVEGISQNRSRRQRHRTHIDQRVGFRQKSASQPEDSKLSPLKQPSLKKADSNFLQVPGMKKKLPTRERKQRSKSSILSAREEPFPDFKSGEVTERPRHEGAIGTGESVENKILAYI